MLIVVHHRDIATLFELFLNNEAFWRFDILEINATKTWGDELDRPNELVNIFGINFDINAINIGKALKEDGLALHDRFTCQSAEVA